MANQTSPMTFAEFQNSKRWHDDLRVALPDEVWGDEDWPPRGYVYADSLYIEGVNEHWPESTQQRGRWYLLLGNAEYVTDDLARLEQILFVYAQEEGIV